ncbi:thiamine phosphate synthase [Mucilaginibacter sp. FT3.2]|uniref:thiamine phosphate synthase n=1 Tax=Mucilaginibacter sp. FT3.2 TaxID=2723090 RepID=UPI00161F13C9|nr:thiamine phosphate synthase [Mucilaginibacter sp. FT3.2]MBB6230795.1 thiamine-phosphate pyrophosphorylase [Mucilaginibacter sp. FT3.2]
MKKYISRFHYLTQDLPDRTHIEQAAIACAAGANWIQYRCMTKPDAELVTEINHIASICDDWGTTLIIANNYHLLNKVDVQGVHIDDMEADFATIRKVIGEDKTLGASATNLPGLLKIQNLDVVDYCAFGPFAHTVSLSNDLPLLGYDGYRLLEKEPLEIPVIAVGGVQLTDVEQLVKTGIYGIAVSSAINLSFDPAGMVKEFYRTLY